MTSPSEPPRSGDASVDVLAVDDNPNNLGSLEALLSDVGANVVKAHSGDEALRHLLGRDFAVILLDIQMPGLDGYETAKLIRSRSRSRHIPIIFVTAHSANEASVTRGYALGAVDFLFKPIVGDILKAKVAVFIDLGRKAREIERHAQLLQRAEQRDHERALAESRREIELEQKRRVTETLEVLSSTAHDLLVGNLDDELLSTLYARLGRYLGLDVFIEHRARPPRDQLFLTTHTGLSELEAQVLASSGPTGRPVQEVVAAARSRVIIPDAAALRTDDYAEIRAAGLAAVACFPLIARTRLVGTLAFAMRSPRVFTGDELGIMQNFADLIAAALERRRLIEELEDRDRRKDEFLAMLAHELRNPLAPIRTSIELMKMPSVQPATTQRALASADRQVSHMARMLDDLLDVSRITKGKVELKIAPVLLSTVIEQALQTTEQLIRERGHALEVKVPEEPIMLHGDLTRLIQVVANLLNNAAKYTAHKGHLKLLAERAGEVVVIRVSDDGAGIRPDMLARVFDIFVQLDPTSDRSQGGLGIGLTLVRRLVEMHGGTVSADSQGLGQGSEFTITLPLPDVRGSSGSVITESARASLADLPPMRVLLIEDNSDIRESMRDLFEMYGHSVEEAADGQEGLERLLSHGPTVAIVDIGLPGLDGYNVAAAVRAASAPAARTLLVAMTGYGHATERERALRAGFDAHIVKPISMNELATVLKTLLSRDYAFAKDHQTHA